MIELKSPRMKRVSVLLEVRGTSGATTKEIEDVCQVASARDYIRRLRDRGYRIATIEEGTSDTGARIVRYRLDTAAG